MASLDTLMRSAGVSPLDVCGEPGETPGEPAGETPALRGGCADAHRANSPTMKLLSLLGYLSMVCGLLLLIATRNLLSLSPAVIVVQVCGTGLALWARVTFGRRSFHLAANPTEGGLVTTGPYRFIRHPIYTGIILIVAASLASHVSLSALLATCLVLGGTLLRIFCEEALVIQRYPEYLEYRTKTWRMIPFVF